MISTSWSATTISSSTVSNSAWGANIGWINFRGDQTNGAVIGDFFCSGYIYAANAGWISLGNGAPQNGYSYANNSATDFGINHDGIGNLRGYAYGPNIGWVNFETTGNPRVDLQTGRFSGYIWSANAGWISLSNSFAVVKTDSFFAGNDSDGDGIADAWEMSHAGSLNAFSSNSDADGDGSKDVQEYLADTDPLNSSDALRITLYSVSFFGGDDVDSITWTSKPTRNYRINYRTNLNSGFSWIDAGVLFAPDGGFTTTRSIGFSGAPSAQRYFRVQAIRPLAP